MLNCEVVGFFGDGLNDALALKECDVGISVDTGSDLAKDTSDVILTAKTLSVISSAVRIGRITHGNTIKYIKMAASSNFGNVFSLLFAAAFLPSTPMQPEKILVQNLLYNLVNWRFLVIKLRMITSSTPKHGTQRFNSFCSLYWAYIINI